MSQQSNEEKPGTSQKHDIQFKAIGSSTVADSYNKFCIGVFNSKDSCTSSYKKPLHYSDVSSLPTDLNWSIHKRILFPANKVSAPGISTKQNAENDQQNVADGNKQQALNIRRSNTEDHSNDISGLLQPSKSPAIEVVPRERKRWVRPPLVGQASNSERSLSQDITSLKAIDTLEQLNDLIQPTFHDEIADFNENDFHPHDIDGTNKISGSVNVVGDFQDNFECAKFSENCESENFVLDNTSTVSNQFQSYGVTAPNHANSGAFLEATASGRAPSPASVSSVTSSRRLEWDSGADVGYQNYHSKGESSTTDCFNTIERFVLSSGCSAALRLEPEGTAGSMQQLTTIQSKPVAVGLKFVSKSPVAVSTPIDKNFGCTVVSSATATDSESEITPMVKCQNGKFSFDESKASYQHSDNIETVYMVPDQYIGSNKGVSNALSKKLSSSLTDLTPCGYNDLHKNTLSRSQSCLSLLSKKNSKNKVFSHHGSFPFRHQQKRNIGLATCSASSSSIATIITKHESPRVSDKVIQTSVFSIPIQHSIGIQVCETEGNHGFANTTSYFPKECEKDNQTGASLSINDSDVIDKTLSNTEEEIINRYFSNSRLTSQMKQNSGASKTAQSNTYQVINHNKTQNKEAVSQSSEVCKGAHRRGSTDHDRCLSTRLNHQKKMSGRPDKGDDLYNFTVDKNSGSKINMGSRKVSHQMYEQQINHSDEEIRGKNCGTLDSVTSSTQTTESGLVGDIPPSSANGIQSVFGRRNSNGVLGSANSFEYLPGHVYESSNVVSVQNLYKNDAVESSTESTSSNQSLGLKGRKFNTSDYVWGNSASSTLARDLEKGIIMLKEAWKSKPYSSDVKKKLIRQVVNRLIETDYPEDVTLLHSLETNVTRILPNSTYQSDNASGCVIKKHGEEGEQKARRSMEREEISGESASEQHQRSNSEPPQTIHEVRKTGQRSQNFYIADKCVGTVCSEVSGLSSPSEKLLLSDHRVDSRAETTTTTSTTGGCEGSSNNNTLTKQGCWKEFTTQSERAYEERKHKLGLQCKNSVLLNLCETERENQLSWIETEIHHLSNLKQLLEKQKNLKNNLAGARLKSHKGSPKKKVHSTGSQRSSEDMSAHSVLSSLVSETVCTSSMNSDRSLNHDRNLKSTSVVPDEQRHVTKLLNSGSRKHVEEVQSAREKYTSDRCRKTSPRRHISTQFPTSIELGNQKEEVINSNKKEVCESHLVKNQAVQTTRIGVASYASSNGDTLELKGDILSDSTATGRINVYIQTLKEKPVSRVDISSKSFETDDSTRMVDDSKLKKSTSLCCCDCKKLLSKISSEIKHTKQKSSTGSSNNNHTKTLNFLHQVDKLNSILTNGKKTKLKLNNSTSCTSSPADTPRNAEELSQGSEDLKKSSVATETVECIGVQTTQSVSSLPLIRPQWYSVATQNTVTAKDKTEKETITGVKKCPCCGNLESQPDTLLEESLQDTESWKCSRCIKMEQYDRKCVSCGILLSQLQNSNDENALDHEIWKCSDCVMKESDNKQSTINKCFHCGNEQAEHHETSGHNKSESTSLSTSSAVTLKLTNTPSLGYVLTLDEVPSIDVKTVKKPLEEIKIKVPVRKKYFASPKEKKKEKLRFHGTRLKQKSNITENQKPVQMMKTNTSRNQHHHHHHPQQHQGSKVGRRQPTLQEYLVANRPDFIQSAEYRRQCLDELAYLRDLRQKSKQRLLALASRSSLFDSDSASMIYSESMPPPPLAVKRVFSQQMMRAQTEQKYHKLPEVISKKADKKRKEDYRTNRLMAEIFARKLQRRVLKGEVNLSNSRSVISV